MSILDANVVDFISVDTDNDEVLLAITDHLDWEEGVGEHLQLLQGKINSYLRFIEGGGLLEFYPESSGKKARVVVLHKYPLIAIAEDFYNKVSNVLNDTGVGFRAELSLIS